MITEQTRFKLSGAGIFWFWNADPSPAGIRRELSEFAHAGFRRVCIHPMTDRFRKEDFHGGMKIAYLGKRYFQLVRFSVAEAKRLGLEIVLYDESGWPSGMVDGTLVQTYPELAAKVLCRIRDNEFRVVDFRPECPFPDLLHPDTGRRFIAATHERYYSVVGDEFGRTISGIFIDEPRLLGRIGTDSIPYSPELREECRRYLGQELETLLPFLFAGAPDREETRLARRRYVTLYTRLLLRNFYKPIQNWCRRHHLRLEGHLSGEDEFGNHFQYLGDYFSVSDCFDIPGIDAIWRQIHPAGGSGTCRNPFPRPAAFLWPCSHHLPRPPCHAGSI